MKNNKNSPPKDFNPRPPWGGRPTYRLRKDKIFGISIHALRGEGDKKNYNRNYSTDISIHALRGEGDPETIGQYTGLKDISIHALRGEGDILTPLSLPRDL